jgi:hypothetical protein
VAGPSDQKDAGDKRKAAFSDALKRAAVKFGIGRYLYNLPGVWCDYTPKSRKADMNKVLARECYRLAEAYVSKHCPEELEWVKSISEDSFAKMNCTEFLGEYCWVVYAAGFKVSILTQKFEKLKAAYCDFNLARICKLELPDAALAIINNQLKAKSFVKGCRLIRDEGFETFKARVKAKGIDELARLPFIGSITKKHLARNIGLLDVAKDDVWLVRLAKAFEASSVDELTDFLSKELAEKVGIVDLILWRYCADGAWEGCDKQFEPTSGCG